MNILPKICIIQHFNPQDRRVAVVVEGVEKFASRDSQFGSFLEAAKYVRDNYQCCDDCIEKLRKIFYADWENYDDSVWW